MDPKKKHIEERVIEIKAYCSYIYRAHLREQTPNLDDADGEKLLHEMVDLLPQAQSLEEALLFTNLLIDMLKSLTSHHLDFLDISLTQAIMLETVDEFSQKSNPTLEDFAQLKTSIEKTKNTFINKALDFIAELNEHQPPGYRLTILKINKLIEQMNAVAITLYVPPTDLSADSAKKLIAELIDEIQKITLISHTDAGDFALEGQAVPPGTPAKTLPHCLDLILKLTQSQLSLKSINSKKEELEVVIGLILAISGTVSGLNANASKIVSAIDTLLTTGCVIKDSIESSSVTSFIKENPFDIMMLGASITSLAVTAFTCPPAVPIVLQSLGVIELSKNGIKIGQKINSTQNVDKAMEIADKFRNALKADQVSRVAERELTQRAQLRVLSPDLSSGQSNNPINQEIRHLVNIARGGPTMLEKLLLGGNQKSTNLVIAAICKKFNGNSQQLRQFWKKLISLSPPDRIRALSKVLGKQIKPKYIERFAQNLSKSLVDRFLAVVADFSKASRHAKTVEELTQMAVVAKSNLVMVDPHDLQSYQQCQQASEQINALFAMAKRKFEPKPTPLPSVAASRHGLFSSNSTNSATTPRPVGIIILPDF